MVAPHSSTRKLTFSFPGTLAAQLTRRVPAQERSRYVAEAVAARLAEQDRALREAAAVVNACTEIREMEQELDALPDIESEIGINNGTRFDTP